MVNWGFEFGQFKITSTLSTLLFHPLLEVVKGYGRSVCVLQSEVAAVLLVLNVACLVPLTYGLSEL